MGKNMQSTAAKRAKAMRDKAMAVAMKRKEEYLGARVPKELKDRVIRRANELGIPVSLLIRKVLEETFTDEASPQFASRVSVKETPQESRELDDANYAAVIGWKELELNKTRQCDRCGRSLPAGSEAIMGITTSGSGMVIICGTCKEQLKT